MLDCTLVEERVAESGDFQASASLGFVLSHFKFKETSQKHSESRELHLLVRYLWL
jgi:hypothetical protein